MVLGCSSQRCWSRHDSRVTIFLFFVIPKGFFPIQDTGVIQGSPSRPVGVLPGMSRQQQQLSKIILQDPAVDNLSSFIGSTAPTLP